MTIDEKTRRHAVLRSNAHARLDAWLDTSLNLLEGFEDTHTFKLELRKQESDVSNACGLYKYVLRAVTSCSEEV